MNSSSPFQLRSGWQLRKVQWNPGSFAGQEEIIAAGGRLHVKQFHQFTAEGDVVELATVKSAKVGRELRFG